MERNVRTGHKRGSHSPAVPEAREPTPVDLPPTSNFAPFSPGTQRTNYHQGKPQIFVDSAGTTVYVQFAMHPEHFSKGVNPRCFPLVVIDVNSVSIATHPFCTRAARQTVLHSTTSSENRKCDFYFTTTRSHLTISTACNLYTTKNLLVMRIKNKYFVNILQWEKNVTFPPRFITTQRHLISAAWIL